MGASNSRDQYYRDQSPAYPGYNNRLQPYDYSTWGYIVLYLVILLVSFILNTLFLVTVKKNKSLHKTAHLMMACLAVRDILVSVLVVPFVMQSEAANLTEWNMGDAMCKLFSFINIGTMATHSFIIIFLTVFLYFWYRKQDSYMTEDGQVVTRKHRLHKWAIPLVWVLGLGLAIPAGASAVESMNRSTMRRSCSVWDERDTGDSGFWILLSVVIVTFIVTLLILAFPTIALMMQVCGSREPRLDPPHSRTALTGIALVLIFICTRGPYEVYTMLRLFGKSYGIKANYIGTPYGMQSFETTIIINAIIYLACILDPIVYFALNPDYRKGLAHAWKTLYCNKDPVQREREAAEKQQRKMQKYPARNRMPAQMRQNQEKLLPQRQPQIMGSKQGVHYQPYAPHQQQQHPQPLPPLQQQQPQLVQHPQMQRMQQQPYIVGQQIHYPQQQLLPDQHFLDTSLDRLSPQLPPVFEYGGLKYIDTARVEPRIGYSPEKTPPKTPETPRYQYKPFQQQQHRIVHPNDIEMVDMTFASTSPQPPLTSQQPQHQPQQRLQPQGPIATSEPKRNSFQIEEMEGSPGSTMRTRRLREDLDETVQMLNESPGSRNNRRRTTQESQQSSGYQSTNGTGVGSSRPTSPLERPGSRQSGVEIVITGRTRSRTDLCPDVPRSKFEHSV